MSLIAGQTAGPNGLKFLVDSHGWQRGVLGEKKIRNCFFQIFFLIIKKKFKFIFHGQIFHEHIF